jgi:hypothetical protein
MALRLARQVSPLLRCCRCRAASGSNQWRRLAIRVQAQQQKGLSDVFSITALRAGGSHEQRVATHSQQPWQAPPPPPQQWQQQPDPRQHFSDSLQQQWDPQQQQQQQQPQQQWQQPLDPQQQQQQQQQSFSNQQIAQEHYPEQQQPPVYDQQQPFYDQQPQQPPPQQQQPQQPPPADREYVVYDAELVNSVSLTLLVAAPPATKSFPSGSTLTKVIATTYAGGGYAKSIPVELEGWGAAAAALAAVRSGEPVTVNGRLDASAPPGVRSSSGSSALPRLRVVVDQLWWIDPATVPAGAAAAPIDPRYTTSGNLSGGGQASGPPGVPMRRIPPAEQLATQFNAPGGSFLAIAEQYGVLPGTLLNKLLDGAKGGAAPVDWSKAVHEVEQFASDGAIAVSEVAPAVDGWVAANPTAVNQDGSPKKALVRGALLGHPTLGARLQQAEAAAGTMAPTYALISTALAARAAGVRLY